MEGHQVPEPGARRRGAADPAPQRLQDRGPDGARPRRRRRRRASCCEAHGYDVHFVGGRRPADAGAPGVRRRRSTTATRRSAPSRTTRARNGVGAAPALAGDRAAHAQGLDRAQGGRRRADRGHVPRAPGAAGRRARRTPRTWRMLEALDAQLPPRRAVRRRAAGCVPELRGAGAARRPPHGRQPARQRRHADRRTSSCPDFARLRASPCRQPATERHESTRQLGQLLRDIFTRNRRNALPPVLSRRDQLEPPRRRVRASRTAASIGADPARRRPRLARRPRHGGAERAPLPGLARGLPADRPPRPVRDLRGVRDGVGVDDGAAHEVAGGEQSSCRGARRSRR